MRIALDTNILAYAEGVNGQHRKDVALTILHGFARQEDMVPAQASGELFVVLTRKAKPEATEARSAVLGWSDSFPLIDTTPAVIQEAMALVTTHRLGFWDSVMLAGAPQAGSRRSAATIITVRDVPDAVQGFDRRSSGREARIIP